MKERGVERRFPSLDRRSCGSSEERIKWLAGNHASEGDPLIGSRLGSYEVTVRVSCVPQPVVKAHTYAVERSV